MVNLVALSRLNTTSMYLKMLVGEVCKNISKISFENSSHTHHINHRRGGHCHHHSRR